MQSRLQLTAVWLAASLLLTPAAAVPAVGQGPTDKEAPSATFCAGVCGEPGDDPCGTVHVVPTTWGNIKAMFR